MKDEIKPKAEILGSLPEGVEYRKIAPPTHSLLRIARCCQDWPVNPLVKMGPCGICGEVPRLTDSNYVPNSSVTGGGDAQ